jgi:hypothetical protein
MKLTRFVSNSGPVSSRAALGTLLLAALAIAPRSGEADVAAGSDFRLLDYAVVAVGESNLEIPGSGPAATVALSVGQAAPPGEAASTGGDLQLVLGFWPAAVARLPEPSGPVSVLAALLALALLRWRRAPRPWNPKRSQHLLQALCLAMVAAALVAAPLHAVADVPLDLNLHGQLADQYGNPLEETETPDIGVGIFASISGGTALYEELHTNVPLDYGAFSLVIGEGLLLEGELDVDTFAGADRYLEISVDGDVLVPRILFNSVPYAFQAQEASLAQDAEALDGRPPGDFDQSSHATETGNPHGTTAAEVGAPTAEEVDTTISTHASNNSAHHTRYADDDAVSAVLAADGSGSGLDADLLDGNEAVYFATATAMSSLQSQLSALQSRVEQLESLLVNVTRSGDDLYFDGMNVHIRNADGATATANELGNLIVGYNENTVSATRTGSHNLVVGINHEYTSYGGLLGGVENTVSGAWASASGGHGNIASGDYTSVTGGRYNTTGGDYASVTGGRNNAAGGEYSSVSGGALNTASSSDSSISGGQYNTASGSASSVSGGYRNEARSFWSSVTGGEDNSASGSYSSITGGRNNEASGSWASVSGGGGNDSDLDGNHAFGNYSAILGGHSNLAGDPALINPDLGEASSVSGGQANTAGGEASSISGGSDNQANAHYSSVSGGLENWAGNVCSGGTNPGAQCLDDDDCTEGGTCGTNQYQSIGGGSSNEASGNSSSVSGGNSNTASGTDDWAAGSLWEDN